MDHARDRYRPPALYADQGNGFVRHTRIIVTYQGGREALRVLEEEYPSRRVVKCE